MTALRRNISGSSGKEHSPSNKPPKKVLKSILHLVIIQGIFLGFVATPVIAASVQFAWESCSGKSCDSIDTNWHYSSPFLVQGSGLYTEEIWKNPADYKGSSRLEYLDPASDLWKIAYYHSAYGTNDYNVIEKTAWVNGYKRYIEKMYNADSYALRLAIAPAYWIGGYGNYEQFAGSIVLKQDFVPFGTNSGLLVRPDLAGGAQDNPQTAFHPDANTCKVGLPSYSVNTSLLNLVIEDTEFGCGSQGHQVNLRRVWNMPPGEDGIFGKGWRFAYESYIAVGKSHPHESRLTLGSGQKLEFLADSIEQGGESLISIRYVRQSLGIGPSLTANINKDTGVGEFTYLDLRTKITQVYEFSGEQAGKWMYRLKVVSDRNGNKISIGYDGAGHLTTVTDASGRITRFHYDLHGRVSRMDAFDGRSASYEYDAAGQLIRNVDLLGTVIRYTYDSNGFIEAMEVAGKTTRFAYATFATGENRIASITAPDGKVTQYSGEFASGSAQNTSIKVTEPSGGEYSYTSYDGRTAYIYSPLKHRNRFKHNDQYLISDAYNPRGWLTTFAYDVNGNLTKLTDPADQITTFTYDDRWNRTSVTNALGQVTRYEYDEHNNLIRETSPLGRVTQYSVDGKGQVTQITQPDGSKYGLSYDLHGNLTGITDPLGNRTQIGYDAQGLNATALIDALGNTTGYTFDANRRLMAITQADGSRIQFTRDCCSLTAVQDGAGHTTRFERDASYRPTGVTDPLGNVLRFAYNADGDLISTTDPLGHTIETGYDADHRPESLSNPLGGKIMFERDENGNLTRLTDERGKRTDMAYDTRDQLVTHEDPLGNTTHAYTRDALGRLTEVTNARGDRIGFDYDADGRVTSKKYNGNSVASYAWDANNRLVSISTSLGIWTYTRDPAGRVTGIAYPDGKRIAMRYDAAGNLMSQTYTDGLEVSYTYDVLNRVSGVTFAGNSLSLGYDAAGNLVSETRSNGVNSAYEYDANQQLTRVSHKKGGAVVADISYTRNAAGLITAEDGKWPLSPSHTFQDASATHDDANGLLTWNTDNYAHDADGNLIKISVGRTFGGVYDPENRLTEVTWSNGKNTRYTYDGLGNRVRTETESGASNLYHDTVGHLLDRVTSNSVLTHYIYAGGRLVASGSAAKGYVFYHFDKTGNTLAQTDTIGQIVGAYAYDAFGKVVAQSGSADTMFTYVGAYGVVGLYDNLYYMRHRFYDSVTGRFIQRDPIGFAGGVNSYEYVGGDPVSFIDPYGLYPHAFANQPFVYDDYGNVIGENNPDEYLTQEQIYVREKTFKSNINMLEAVDMAMNYSPEKIGTPYTFVKALLIKLDYSGCGKPGEGNFRALLELAKWGAAVYYGGTVGLGLDVYQKSLEWWASALNMLAKDRPEYVPRWGVIREYQ